MGGWTAHHYKEAQLLSVITRGDYDVYMDAWKQNSKAYRLAWIYHYMFDPTYRNRDPKLSPAEQKPKIRVFDKAEALAKLGYAENILTDDKKAIKNLFGDKVRVIKKFKHNGKRLWRLHREVS